MGPPPVISTVPEQRAGPHRRMQGNRKRLCECGRREGKVRRNRMTLALLHGDEFEKPPCMCGNRLALPMKKTLRQRFARPSRQAAQRPQLRPGWIATRSPCLTQVYAGAEPGHFAGFVPGTNGSRIAKSPFRPSK